ncbi:MAG: hypothetical protein HRU19_09445 [Pseudobacteriovorax sp.]|nr:hypothetical protein [Pseudobacteriovorax sp.]
MTVWHDFPMGPSLRRYLGINVNLYRGDSSEKPSEQRLLEFQNYVIEKLNKKPVETDDELTNLLEESVSMGMGKAAIALTEKHPINNLEDFRYLLNLGSALMLEDKYDLALDFFIRAQAAEPSEISPYVNTASIYYSKHMDDEAIMWTQAGLRVDPTHQRLWEYLASLFIYRDRELAGEKVKEFATELNSHVGLSLAAQLLSPDDKLLKAELLGIPFDSGTRDDLYLIEYTAALGMAMQYEKIPSILWQLEQVDGKQASWRLLTHVVQAYFGLNKEKEAKDLIARLEKNPETPQSIVKDLRSTYDQQFESDT